MPQKAQMSPPRLRSLDDLFQNQDNEPIKETFRDNLVTIIPIEQTTPFPNHPFRLYVGERLQDMVDSIASNGILIPIIVREVEGKYQILSGHNRVNAARLAGRTHVPAIVKTGISDELALVYVIQTNLLQRSFSDMAHSEKAAVIALHHSKLFSQGKRNDIISELETLDALFSDGEKETSVEKSQKLSSRDALAEEYGLKAFRIAEYLRVNKLVPQLKERLDKKEFAVSPAVHLSYLKTSEQFEVDKALMLNKFKVDSNKAVLLHKYAKAGKLDADTVFCILSGEISDITKAKALATPTIRIRKNMYAKYFKPEQSADEIQDIIEQALEFYYANKEEPKMSKTG